MSNPETIEQLIANLVPHEFDGDSACNIMIDEPCDCGAAKIQTQALVAIKEIVERDVIGEDVDDSERVRPGKDYPTINLTEIYYNRHRAEQRQALQTALYGPTNDKERS